MKFFAAVLALFLGAASAFQMSMPKLGSEVVSAMPKFAAGAFPAAIAAPAFAQSEIVSQLPTQLLSLEVTFAAYLAVLLGTFVPVAFLIILYIQSAASGAVGPPDDE
uniref:Photosystem II reaction center protein M n=1 Tax=Heterosigma akashiwo TaxID=2829 RepID=A0A6V2RIP2_HETAK|mmetsp:Transcript_8742/g.12217  ORF Transcript_8742/g.12217 Transcript_8742/m.12217 type:complete len:107 (+) Transcript_8742:72-392(+)|eukprot:CAMPEP_0194570114 /NCGR_PEP_ID=MMETSP0292-20121207/7558_1 /TAXON_ID=39354 /ORGANISM="Heterosigma akashiwo, Strain CCMP2393" /LENGTH=106 /DNA_ID=CAMNT_0039420497 /DNA_START=125 /DNA_END=445 /DNA_ORIENTATION=+